MSDVEKLHYKLMTCPLNELLSACALAVESKMDESGVDFLFIILETRLQKRRMLKKMGIKDDSE
ncbi:hypothetical protein [Immundisolibacter sp.]